MMSLVSFKVNLEVDALCMKKLRVILLFQQNLNILLHVASKHAL